MDRMEELIVELMTVENVWCRLVLYAFVASWYGWFWSTAKFGDN